MPKKNSRELTDDVIDGLPKAHRGKRSELFDSVVPGLCLRVTDKGRKSWSVYFRINGKNSRLTLGAHPEMEVADARSAAGMARDQAKANIDPRTMREVAKANARAEARAKAEALRLFGPLAEKYVEREIPKLKRGKEIEAIIRREILPYWKDQPVAELRKRDAIVLLDRLIDAGHPAAAHRLAERIKRVFNWLVERDEIEVSPMAALKSGAKLESRARTLNDAEIKTLWAALDKVGEPIGSLVKLLLLTGQRRSEVAEMTRAELDFDKAEWTIPAERSKNGKPHIVPLAPAAVDLLKSLPEFTAGPYLFSTQHGRKPISGFTKMKARIDEIAPLPHWVIHDLRRTCRTKLSALGVSEVVAERVLNHVPRGMAKVYNMHEFLPEKREALEKWAARLRDILEPAPANVVKLDEAG